MTTPRIAPHPLEAANRVAKTRRIVAFLDENGRGHTASTTLEQLTGAQWLTIVQRMPERSAGKPETMPSTETIAGVIAYFRAREDAAADADPFDGLGF